MQAPLSLIMQVTVNESGFNQVPAWLVGFIASWIGLALSRRLGNKVRSDESRALDLVIDLISLLFAGSVVASLSATPFVSSLTASISRNITAWTVGDFRLGDGVIIAGTVILVIIVIAVGYLYMKTETKWWLFWFGIGLQVVALFAPWVNDALSWWINNPITWIWNFIIGVLTFLPNIRVNF